jgi:glucose-6-phosphate isomerase
LEYLTDSALYTLYDPKTGRLQGAPQVERRLSDLRGCFADRFAYEARLVQDDPVIYSVSSLETAQGDGQLHYGLGIVAPGRIGDEYFMTKGHLHAWRAAAEVYIGLSGAGAMLLEHEQTGETHFVPLAANSIVYVPGCTAHRTINTGDTPLVYLGVYPAGAGHDYAPIAARNFRKMVVAVDGCPVLADRPNDAGTPIR